MEQLRRAARTEPAPEPQARALALGRMLVAAGALGLVGLAAAGGRGLPLGILATLSVASIVVGALVLRYGPRLPPQAFHGLLAAGWLAVGAATHLAGGGNAGMAMGILAVWAALYAGLFFTPVATALHTTGAVGVVAAGLAAGGEEWVFEVVWLAGVAAVVGGVTNWMSYRRVPARLDALTGLPGHRGLADVLEARMREARDAETPLTLGLIDLDDFSNVNRVEGPGAGDRLLRSCVHQWQPRLPPGATLARRGSDEFVVVLPGYVLAEGRELIESLRGGLDAPVTCSAGVTAWFPDDTQSLLLARADTALYAAKVAGRDRTEVAGEDFEWLAELRRALDADDADDADEIVVHYQPVHAVDDGRLVALEALVRWQHPERGLLAPGAFLPTAEAGGVMHQLGRRVLHLVCGQLRQWHDRYPQHERLRVSINLSPAQLVHPRVLADIEEALRDHGLGADSLYLEVTEGALADEDVETVAVLWELKDRGIRLALDDFGTGHSSLSRLRSLPFDVIKIDRSFVRPLGSEDASGEALFSVIVRMAESLGMLAVAEGVETERELAVVARHGATYAQGFLLGRPAPPEEIEHRLAASAGARPARGEGAVEAGAPDEPLLAADRPAAFDPPAVAGQAATHRAGPTGDQGTDPGAYPGLDPAGRRVLRSLLAHVVGATGMEVAYVSEVDLSAGEQRVLAVHHAPDHVLRVEEGTRVDWHASICRHALLDLAGDDRMGTDGGQVELTSPVVAGGLVRTYATAPVKLSDGTLFGTVCAISSAPVEIDAGATRLLEFVARLVGAQVEHPRSHGGGGGGDTGHGAARP
jgi:diguanylate cyclase (GGDEF)-like protein